MEIGNETHKYEVIDDWAKLPANLVFGTTHGVVEDKKGNIYIHHTGKQSVIRFRPDGTFIDSWGDEYESGAHGMHLRREGEDEFLYLSATSLGFVAKTTLDGEEIFRITTPDLADIYDEEHLFVPTETAVASDGRIYVTDGYGQSWVHVYSSDGKYIKSFGGMGSGRGELSNPHGIMIDTRGGNERVLVSDRANHRLQYFTLDGIHDGFVDHDLRLPCTTIQLKDEIYIPDLHSRLTILDADDKVITHLGDRPGIWDKDGWPNLPKSDWISGKFSSPHDLHVDKSGNIYLAEWLSEGTGKVTKLRRLE
ncbi:MAG: 6-bladed beta-propeller [Spirochaetales bacterium]|jgi:hypothetical protein|nr:6-bladed beta-propeller [Spirochaetales bacterium]